MNKYYKGHDACRIEDLVVAQERVYPVSDPKTAAQIELDQ